MLNKLVVRVSLVLLATTSTLVVGWSAPSSSSTSSTSTSAPLSRRNAWKAAAASAVAVATTVTTGAMVQPAQAATAATTADEKKLYNLSNEELAKIITQDVQEGQFMVKADLTRAVYDEGATFTDEIDTYALDAWIRGTKRLFVANKSHVDLVPQSLTVSEAQATFLFTEYLTFNIPFLQPKVYLTGKVILKRDPTSGLITSYQEQWDQDVKDVLTSAKLFGSNSGVGGQ
jgi:hypothetical protein